MLPVESEAPTGLETTSLGYQIDESYSTHQTLEKQRVMKRTK